MDPQKLSQLDPKLRDAYQRVMGTDTPKPQTAAPTPTPTPTPNINPAITPDKPDQPTQPTIQPPPAITPQPPTQASNFDQLNSQVVSAPASANFASPAATMQQPITIKKKNSITPILIVIAGIIFLVVYALFWMKIFSFQLPFLP